MIDERYIILLLMIFGMIGMTILIFYDEKQLRKTEKKYERKLYLMHGPGADLDKLEREFGGDRTIDFPFWREQKRRKEQMEIARRKWFGEEKK